MHRVQQAAAVFVACWACSASADTADVVPEPETPAELAAFLRHCATLLGPRDYGLARVARQCPGVEYHVLHGPLAEALRDPHWAATVSRAGLLELAAVADTYGRPSAQALDRASLAIELERSQDHEQVARGWWKRFNDWLERVFAQPEDAPDPDNWLGRLLRKVFADGPSAATVERISVGIVIAMALAVLAIGWWQFSPNRRARRRAAQNAMSGSPGDSPDLLAPLPDGLAARLCARFAQRVAVAEQVGLLPGARALSCGELRARAAQSPTLATLAQAAPIVERARYAPTPPGDSEMAATDARLAALEIDG